MIRLLIPVLLATIQLPVFAAQATRAQGCAMMLAGANANMLNHFKRYTIGNYDPRLDILAEEAVKEHISSLVDAPEVVAVRITRSITLPDQSTFFEISVAVRKNPNDLTYLESLQVRLDDKEVGAVRAPSHDSNFHSFHDLAQDAVAIELPNGLLPSTVKVNMLAVKTVLSTARDAGIAVVEILTGTSRADFKAYEVPVEIRGGRVIGVGEATLQREPESTPLKK